MNNLYFIETEYNEILNNKVDNILKENNVSKDNLIVYDMEEDSLNRYYDEEVKVVNHEMQRLKNDAVLFMGVAAGITIVTIMASIISTIKRKRKNNRL